MVAQIRGNDCPPPPHWPSSVIYLTKPRLSPSLPSSLLPFLSTPASANLLPASTSKVYSPRTSKHPSHVAIKQIVQSSHPANGQFGLFAKSKIKGDELIIPYFGVIHVAYASAIDVDTTDTHTENQNEKDDEHSSSDYDLSLMRISASDPRNPFPRQHLSIGIDAARAGNAARFVNDYRGIKLDGTGPNAEFRVGKDENGYLRMEIWSLKCGVAKGEEVLVSYGKGWWGARR